MIFISLLVYLVLDVLFSLFVLSFPLFFSLLVLFLFHFLSLSLTHTTILSPISQALLNFENKLTTERKLSESLKMLEARLMSCRLSREKEERQRREKLERTSNMLFDCQAVNARLQSDIRVEVLAVRKQQQQQQKFSLFFFSAAVIFFPLLSYPCSTHHCSSS